MSLNRVLESILGLVVIALLSAGCVPGGSNDPIWDSFEDHPSAACQAHWSLPAPDYPAPHQAEVTKLYAPLLSSGAMRGLVVGIVSPSGREAYSFGVRGPSDPSLPTVRDYFGLASVSKLFTGLLIQDAIQRGEIADIDDPVEFYLSKVGIPVPTYQGQKITFRHLVTHSSGFPHDFPAGAERDSRSGYSGFGYPELFSFLDSYQLTYAPGTKVAYSNAGVSVLGAALIAITGKSYQQLLRERVLDPMGMPCTHTDYQDEDQARTAFGFDAKGNQWYPMISSAYRPVGGVVSSVEDLMSFAEAQLGRRADSELAPLTNATLKASHRKLVELGGTAVATNWFFDDDGAVLWHNGDIPGYHTYLGINPKANLAVVALSTNEVDGGDGQWLLEGESVQPLEHQLGKQLLGVVSGLGNSK